MDRDAYLRFGQNLTKQHLESLQAQLSVFQQALINFAKDHSAQIKQKPEFQRQFSAMCRQVGVDPMELLLLEPRSLHDALSVRIVEVCQETQAMNGGLILLREVHSRIKDGLSVPVEIKEADVEKSAAILALMGSGYNLETISGNQWLKFGGDAVLQSHRRVYELCEFTGGYVTYRLLRDNFGWDSVRLQSVLEDMIMCGFLWIDTQGSLDMYWEPLWM